MKWCEVLGTEPYLCLNFGTGTLDEGILPTILLKMELQIADEPCSALAWVEYCNGTCDTYYANMRRKNGREQPYNVRLPQGNTEHPYANSA